MPQFPGPNFPTWLFFAALAWAQIHRKAERECCDGNLRESLLGWEQMNR
jgi:hypothetical protein